MRALFLGISTALLLAFCALAQDLVGETEEMSPPDSAVRSPSRDTMSVTSSPRTQVLTTEAGALDSLDILPTELETESHGGIRKIDLQKTVFHRETPFTYTSGGRRDPFRALIVDERKEGEVKTDLLRLEQAVLTGVIWSDGKYLAMVRDKDGKTFFLREGDDVYSGRVLMVTQARIVFELSNFGDYSRVTLDIEG